MGKFLKILPPLVLLGLALIVSGCLLEEKTIQVVVSEKMSVEYKHSSPSKDFSTFVIVDFAAELDDVLGEQGVEKSDIQYAFVTSLAYGVTFIPDTLTHDWDISGQMLIGRGDISTGPDTLMTYTNQSVRDALDQVIPARLNQDGVGVINQALQQYIDDTHSPRLVFIVENDEVDPEPNLGDYIVFTWKIWFEIQVIFEETVDVPDPL